MKRLTEKELQSAIDKMVRDYDIGNEPDMNYYSRPAKIEFPLSEMTRISRKVWVWGMSGKVSRRRTNKSDRLAIQGIEEVVVVDGISYIDVLLTANELPEYRRHVYV